MNSSISTGTSVTPSSAAKNIENVLVNASGLNKRPSCASSENTGMKLTVMTSNAKKSGRPTLLAAAMMTSTRSAVGWIAAFLLAEMFQEFVGVLDHDDGRIHHRADGDGDAAQRHDVRSQMPVQYIGRNESRMAMGSVMMATSAERMCQRNTRQTSATTMLSSISFSRSVAMERLISWLRS